MGSLYEAKMVRYVCRLCSQLKKIVIHLYSAKARQMKLVEKMKLLPISLNKYDNLPKTVCESCIEKLNMQYSLFLRIRKAENVYRAHRIYHANGACPIECPLRENPR